MSYEIRNRIEQRIASEASTIARTFLRAAWDVLQSEVEDENVKVFYLALKDYGGSHWNLSTDCACIAVMPTLEEILPILESAIATFANGSSVNREVTAHGGVQIITVTKVSEPTSLTAIESELFPRLSADEFIWNSSLVPPDDVILMAGLFINRALRSFSDNKHDIDRILELFDVAQHPAATLYVLMKTRDYNEQLPHWQNCLAKLKTVDVLATSTVTV